MILNPEKLILNEETVAELSRTVKELILERMIRNGSNGKKSGEDDTGGKTAESMRVLPRVNG